MRTVYTFPVLPRTLKVSRSSFGFLSRSIIKNLVDLNKGLPHGRAGVPLAHYACYTLLNVLRTRSLNARGSLFRNSCLGCCFASALEVRSATCTRSCPPCNKTRIVFEYRCLAFAAHLQSRSTGQPNSGHLPPLPHTLISSRSNSTMLQSDKRRMWRLERDKRPAARQRAVAMEDICAGATITTVSPLCTSLLPAWRGKRCDMCTSTPAPEHSRGLSACSRCKSAWYCNAECKEYTLVSGHSGSTTCRPVA